MRRVILFTITLFFLLLYERTPAWAFWPPLRDVHAWIESGGSTVHCKVYDPLRVSWKEMISDQGSIYNLTTGDGVVTWNTGSGFVGAAVYDPVFGSWKQYSSFQVNVFNLTTSNGVVAWNTQTGFVGATVYDPIVGAWKEWISSYQGSVFNLTNSDGVVAWQTQTGFVGTAIYDPRRASWKEWKSSQGNSSNLGIVNGTVTWEINDVIYTRGYDHNSGSWYDGPTKPLAYFQASPTSGNSPLWVWFTDMSIGGTSWVWTFDDGSGTGERSPYHTFAPGVFTVTETVMGPGGIYSESVTISTVTCSTWDDIIAMYQDYLDGQAMWADVIKCYQVYTSESE